VGDLRRCNTPAQHTALRRTNRRNHGHRHGRQSSRAKVLDLVPSFRRHLRAENKSPKTITSYTEAVRRLHDFLTANGMPLEVASITAEHIETFSTR
jgi:hypothetical protein